MKRNEIRICKNAKEQDYSILLERYRKMEFEDCVILDGKVGTLGAGSDLDLASI